MRNYQMCETCEHDDNDPDSSDYCAICVDSSEYIESRYAQDTRRKKELQELINLWAESERTYVSTAIKFPIGSKQEQKDLRTMEEIRSKVISSLPIIEG